jgi:endonuclease/exonuclease/phosphatase family metal-dependent hydrolase
LPHSAIRIAGLLLALTMASFVALIAAAISSEFTPAELEPLVAQCDDRVPELAAGSSFTAVSWNLQYSAGRAQHFFYDGGTAVSVPDREVSETLSGITAALRNIAPDVALLQEVDRASDRTRRIDQLPPYRAATNSPCQLSTPYHRSPFVPHPLRDPMGRVDMHLALLTPAGLIKGQRRALPLLKESRLRQAFNLKRALLTAELPIADSAHNLAIAVSHLSAFSTHGDTLSNQMNALKDWMDERPPEQPWILGADLNAIAPGDDPNRLSANANTYREAQPALAALLSAHKSVFDPLDPAQRTFLPFGSNQPDRTIDYLFYGGPLELKEARVAGEYSSLSDHLPLVARFTLNRNENSEKLQIPTE